MDSDILKNIPDCKTCQFWKDYIGKCVKKSDIRCPKGVSKPRQTVALMQYRSLT